SRVWPLGLAAAVTGAKPTHCWSPTTAPARPGSISSHPHRVTRTSQLHRRAPPSRATQHRLRRRCSLSLEPPSSAPVTPNPILVRRWGACSDGEAWWSCDDDFSSPPSSSPLPKSVTADEEPFKPRGCLTSPLYLRGGGKQQPTRWGLWFAIAVPLLVSGQ
ncbi:hypothetical protein Dimus_026436, partial [Dionaea muscipula]